MSCDSRIRLLEVLEILKHTDEDHRKTIPQIVGELKKKGISAERKAVAKDIDSIEEVGFSILRPAGNHLDGYAMTDQNIENYEWKILADSVNAARFLTESDSRALIRKIIKEATENGRELIKKTTPLHTMYKSKDTRNKYKIAQIFRAISLQKKISFRYRESDDVSAPAKKKNYEVSGYALVLWHEEYYLIAATDTHDNPIHFRVERMMNISISTKPVRPMKEIEGLTNEKNKEDIPGYISRTNGMWGGTELIQLELSFPKSMKSYITRQFGGTLDLCYNEHEALYHAWVTVYDNPGLYQTLSRYGTHLRIVAPTAVKNRYISYIKNILALYE